LKLAYLPLTDLLSHRFVPDLHLLASTFSRFNLLLQLCFQLLGRLLKLFEHITGFLQSLLMFLSKRLVILELLGSALKANL